LLSKVTPYVRRRLHHLIVVDLPPPPKQSKTVEETRIVMRCINNDNPRTYTRRITTTTEASKGSQGCCQPTHDAYTLSRRLNGRIISVATLLLAAHSFCCCSTLLGLAFSERDMMLLHQLEQGLDLRHLTSCWFTFPIQNRHTFLVNRLGRDRPMLQFVGADQHEHRRTSRWIRLTHYHRVRSPHTTCASDQRQ
jgi:hypothetical protein